jgi:hypothetical protein
MLILAAILCVVGTVLSTIGTWNKQNTARTNFILVQVGGALNILGCVLIIFNA